MLQASLLTLTAGTLLLLTAQAVAQEQEPEQAEAPGVIDLLRDPLLSHQLHVSAYNPRVAPQIRLIRSHDEATLFCAEAWDEENDALRIDFAREQILVVAWGALRFNDQSGGASLSIDLEQATIEDGTLRVKVRTSMPPGPDIDIAPERAGRTWYPSLFVRTPRTDRVEVDLIGARRRKPAADFRPLATPALEIRVAPDASPSRELVASTFRRETQAATKPAIVLCERGDLQVLEIAWGKLDAGSYRIDLVGVLIDKGIAHLTVRANNRRIFLYSGPGEHSPGLAIALPRVEKVLLHIERTGIPLLATEPDFEAQSSDRLSVTVDQSAVSTDRRKR